MVGWDGNANGGAKKESAHLGCIADTHRPVMHGRVQHGVMPITGSSDSFSNFSSSHNIFSLQPHSEGGGRTDDGYVFPITQLQGGRLKWLKY